MRSKSWLNIIFIPIILSVNGFCSDKLSYGIKTGINFCRFTSLNGYISIANFPQYSYPLGYSIGIFMENKLSQNISIDVELFYQNSEEKVVVYTGIEGILEQNLNTQYINVPILLKYQTQWLLETSIFLGPSIGYIIKSNYNYYDRIYYDKWKGDITESLPSINSGIEFGLGERYEIENYFILMELRAEIGLTEFKYQNIGSWHNTMLSFLVGLQFK